MKTAACLGLPISKSGVEIAPRPDVSCPTAGHGPANSPPTECRLKGDRSVPAGYSSTSFFPAVMSSLRILSLSYLATASLMMFAVVFSDHAALRQATMHGTDAVAGMVRQRLLQPVLSFARLERFGPTTVVPVSAPGPNDARLLAHVVVPARPMTKVTANPESFIIVPDLADIDVPPPLPYFAEPEKVNPLPPDLDGGSKLTDADRAVVASRFSRNLTREMLGHFDLFVYVSKAKSGPLAQR